MKKIKTILIDDERLARVELRNQLQAFSQVQVMAEAGNAKEGLALIQSHKPDLIFLDVQMPGQTGFDLLEEMEESPQVIFMTAYEEYAIKAFEFNALDYLLKPVQEARLREALERVQKNGSQSDLAVDKDLPLYGSHLYIKDGDQHFFISLQDINLFSSYGNYVKVHHQEKATLVHRSLNQIEARLPEGNFFRANRYTIINVSFIQSIRQGSRGKLILSLPNGIEVEVSERKSILFRDKWSV